MRKIFSCPPLQDGGCRRSAPSLVAKTVLAGHDHAVSRDSGLRIRGEWRGIQANNRDVFVTTSVGIHADARDTLHAAYGDPSPRMIYTNGGRMDSRTIAGYETLDWE